jgi:hypothetical protein
MSDGVDKKVSHGGSPCGAHSAPRGARSAWSAGLALVALVAAVTVASPSHAACFDPPDPVLWLVD